VGSWFNFHGERLGQGRENARNFLVEHPDTVTKIDAEVRSALGLAQTEATPSKGSVSQSAAKAAQTA
jgi:recombination protein RecA